MGWLKDRWDDLRDSVEDFTRGVGNVLEKGFAIVDNIISDPKKLLAVGISIAFPGAATALGNYLLPASLAGSTAATVLGSTAINTLTNGGNVEEALKSAVISAGVSGLTSELKIQFASEDISKALTDIAASTTAQVGLAAVLGKDPTSALIFGGIQAATQVISEQVTGTGELKAAYDKLPSIAKTALTAAVSAALTGKDAEGAIANALVGDAIKGMTNAVKLQDAAIKKGYEAFDEEKLIKYAFDLDSGLVDNFRHTEVTERFVQNLIDAESQLGEELNQYQINALAEKTNTDIYAPSYQQELNSLQINEALRKAEYKQLVEEDGNPENLTFEEFDKNKNAEARALRQQAEEDADAEYNASQKTIQDKRLADFQAELDERFAKTYGYENAAAWKADTAEKTRQKSAKDAGFPDADTFDDYGGNIAAYLANKPDDADQIESLVTPSAPVDTKAPGTPVNTETPVVQEKTEQELRDIRAQEFGFASDKELQAYNKAQSDRLYQAQLDEHNAAMAEALAKSYGFNSAAEFEADKSAKAAGFPDAKTFDDYGGDIASYNTAIANKKIEEMVSGPSADVALTGGIKEADIKTIEELRDMGITLPKVPMPPPTLLPEVVITPPTKAEIDNILTAEDEEQEDDLQKSIDDYETLQDNLEAQAVISGFPNYATMQKYRGDINSYNQDQYDAAEQKRQDDARAAGFPDADTFDQYGGRFDAYQRQLDREERFRLSQEKYKTRRLEDDAKAAGFPNAATFNLYGGDINAYNTYLAEEEAKKAVVPGGSTLTGDEEKVTDNEIIDIVGGNGSIVGGTGGDTLIGREDTGGANTVTGGILDDGLGDGTETGSVTVDGGTTSDNISLNDSLNGSLVGDTISDKGIIDIVGGETTMDGGTGTDIIDGKDTLTGGSEVVDNGVTNEDDLIGGTGDATLEGGVSTDTTGSDGLDGGLLDGGTGTSNNGVTSEDDWLGGTGGDALDGGVSTDTSGSNDPLFDLSSEEVGQGEVDAINDDALLGLSSSEVGEGEQKAIDEAEGTKDCEPGFHDNGSGLCVSDEDEPALKECDPGYVRNLGTGECEPAPGPVAVSYTHLTLPTICSV